MFCYPFRILNSIWYDFFVCFIADITKTMLAKRKRLEQLTQNSLKSTNKKVEDIWTMQKNERFVLV